MRTDLVKNLLRIAVIFLSNFVKCSRAIDQKTLRFVHVLWRHGERSPVHPPFPTDTENPVSSWPLGLGELTSKGLRSQFQLGEWLRKRYDGFISKSYRPDQIFVRSTDYNRTLMSALANMAGFYYPPAKDQQFHPDIPWMPVPVRSFPTDLDPILNMHAACPKVAKFSAESLASQAAKNFMHQNAEFVRFLSEKTGLNITNPKDIGLVYDPVFCQASHNESHRVPKFVNQTVFNRIVELHDESTKFFVSRPEWQRLQGGPLLGDIVARMLNVANGSMRNSGLKYYAYSAHDDTIQALLTAMGVYNHHLPPYCATVMVELHERSTSDENGANRRFEVEVFYRNHSKHDLPVQLDPFGCGLPACSLEKFAGFSASRIPDDWNQECIVGLSSQMMWKGLATGLGVAMTLFGVLLLFVLYMNMRLRRKISKICLRACGLNNRSTFRFMKDDRKRGRRYIRVPVEEVSLDDLNSNE